MKATKILKTLVPAVAVAVTIAACTQDTDYKTPTISYDNVTDIEGDTTSIAAVQARYDQAGEITTFEDDTELYVEGYVVSSDQSGNFYEEFYIQSTPNAEGTAENPKRGIKLLINEASLYTKFDFGRKIWIHLNGLSVGLDSGVYALGHDDGSGYLAQIESWEFDESEDGLILRSSEVATIEPKTVESISDLSSDDLGTYVEIQNLQLSEDDFGLTYAGEEADSYQGERTFESCTGSSVTLYTSSYADFKSLLVPSANKGSITGIFARDYYDDYNVLMINETDDIQFTEGRCSTIYSQDFTEGFGEWTQVSVVGSQTWYVSQYGNPDYSAYISGYSGSAQDNEDWLITPSFDLTAYGPITMSFETARRYTGNEIETYISTDYTGDEADFASATWTLIEDVIYDTDTSTWYSWTNSGNISLEDYASENNVHIAFKYTSDSSGAAGWELDNFSLREN
ncbi:hypothetical protein SAMN05216480_1132 [Pustulibacterium marinum]|uniref:DUF5689 domain-containing protein n=1 Tax=Pustulibacterium marinum TaxID=1224947 RepID=A0A1I7I5E2_9FLAO|nr:DUF5689 domain-containing protein [Pustulibacterium marinum]SFU68137.1 hypothetical protein SAMN05216480_1132 [Pustulibacterium marinum]